MQVFFIGPLVEVGGIFQREESFTCMVACNTYMSIFS
jgi:hypothetical protein